MDPETLEFNAGATLVKQGELEAHAFIIDSGSVKIVVKENDHEQIMGIAVAGDVVGELALFEDAPRSANVVAVEGARVRKVTREILSCWMQTDPGASMPFLKAILERLRTGNAMLLAAQQTQDLVRKTHVHLVLDPISGEEGLGGQVMVELEVTPDRSTVEILKVEPKGRYRASANAHLPGMKR